MFGMCVSKTKALLNVIFSGGGEGGGGVEKINPTELPRVQALATLCTIFLMVF